MGVEVVLSDVSADARRPRTAADRAAARRSAGATRGGSMAKSARSSRRPGGGGGQAALPPARGGGRGGEARLRQVRRDRRGRDAPRRRPQARRPDGARHGRSCRTAWRQGQARAGHRLAARRSGRRRRRAPTTSAARRWSTKIQGENWLDFDAVVATPDMMQVGRQAREGARPARPDAQPEDRHRDLRRRQGGAGDQGRQGRVPRRQDRRSSTRPIGKVSFGADKLLENAQALIDSVLKAKPAAAKGKYVEVASRCPRRWVPG